MTNASMVHGGAAELAGLNKSLLVIAAKAGGASQQPSWSSSSFNGLQKRWIPAFAGMTKDGSRRSPASAISELRLRIGVASRLQRSYRRGRDCRPVGEAQTCAFAFR